MLCSGRSPRHHAHPKMTSTEHEKLLCNSFETGQHTTIKTRFLKQGLHRSMFNSLADGSRKQTAGNSGHII